MNIRKSIHAERILGLPEDRGAVEAAHRKQHIETKLREGLAAQHVEVIDESHMHAGHEGAKSGGGHFRVTIVSQRFEGLSRVRAQQLVYGVLADEMRADIHALSMTTFTPETWDAR